MSSCRLLNDQEAGILCALIFGMIHRQICLFSSMKKTKGPGLLLIGVGSMMTSMIAAGFILGYIVDMWLNTQPIFLISFGALGLIGGFLKVYRLLSDPELY
jgi:hypothetical protein